MTGYYTYRGTQPWTPGDEPPDDADELLSPTQASREYDIPVESLRKAALRGTVRCVRQPNGWRRYRRDDVAAFKAKRENGRNRDG